MAATVSSPVKLSLQKGGDPRVEIPKKVFYGFDAGAGDGLIMGNQSVRSPGHTLAVRVKKKNMHNKSPGQR